MKKKVETKKVATKKVVEPVEALTEFEGNAINRDGDYITFGCGAVSVNRADVLALAEVTDIPAFKKMADPLTLIQGYDSRIMFENIEEFTQAAKAFVNLSTTYKKATAALISLIEDSNSDYSVDELLEISSKQLLAIVGPKPSRNVKGKA